jgi:putative heme-binding domain-containing protein
LKQASTVLVLRDALQFRGAAVPDDLLRWGVEAAEQLLGSGQPASVREAIRLARALRTKSLCEPISQIVAGRDPQGLRQDAISMLGEVDPDKWLDLISGVLADGGELLAVRQHAAGVLGQRQTEAVHERLVKQLRTAPEQLAVHVASALAGGPAGANALLDEVAAGKVSARILQNPFVHGRLMAARVPDAGQRIAELTQGLPPAEQRLQQTIEARRVGYFKAQSDRQRGAMLFEKHCAICHRLGDRGAKIGPQLDGVGARGLDRLLEDVLDPTRNVDQAFRTTILALKNGRQISGLLVNDTGNVLTLADAQGQLTQIPKDDIDEQTTSKLSPMPANVVDLLSESELYDLISFLLEQRQ